MRDPSTLRQVEQVDGIGTMLQRRKDQGTDDIRVTRWTGPIATCAGLAFTCFGCATMTLEPATSVDRVVGTRQVPENGDRFTPQVTEDGAVVQLQLDGECQLRTYDRVETTRHFSTTNKSAWVDWTAGVGGAAFVGLGAFALADASKTYPNDTSSRTYNPSGPGADTGLAITSFIAAGALLTVAVVDVIRAQHTEHTRSYEERVGSVSGMCGTRPFATTSVRLKFPDHQILDGTTDANGSVRLDASGIRWTPGSAQAGTATVVVSGKSPGVQINLPQYAAWQQQRAAASREEEAAAARCNTQCTNAQAQCMAAQYVSFHRQPGEGLPDGAIWQCNDAEKDCNAKCVEAARSRPKQEENASVALDNLEQAAATVERILPVFEHAREPWGLHELEQVQPMSEALAAIRRSSQTLGRPFDPALMPRAQALLPRLQQVMARTKAIIPRVQHAAELYQRQRNAEAVALIQAWLGASSDAGGGGGVIGNSSSSSDGSRFRDMEQSHQSERAEDERRHQREREEDQRTRAEGERKRSDDDQRRQADEQTRRNSAARDCKYRCDQQSYTCSNRCSDAENRCRDACPNGSGWTSCKDGCHDTGNRCRQACTEDGRSCGGGCQ